MPRAVSVEKMVKSARQRADYENNNHVTDDELVTWIAEEYLHYYDELVSANPAFYQLEAAVSTEAGEKFYDLPDDWYGTMFVDYVPAGGEQAIPVKLLAPDERLAFRQRGRPTRHQVEGGQLAIYPPPDGVYELVHTYVPIPPPITGTEDTIDGLLGNEELIEWAVCIRILMKENSETTDARLEFDKALARVKEAAFQREVIEAQIAGSPSRSTGGLGGLPGEYESHGIDGFLG